MSGYKFFLAIAMNPSNRRNYYCQDFFPQPRNKWFFFYDQNLHHPSGSHFYHSTKVNSQEPHGKKHFYHCTKVDSGEFNRIFSSSSLQHWFRNWQERRKHIMTASTFGGAVGFWSGRRVQLWKEKVGTIEPFTGNSATCWDHTKKEIAAKRYEHHTENNIYFPGLIYGTKNYEWLAASADGVVNRVVKGDVSCSGVLEIVCPDSSCDTNNISQLKRIPSYCIPKAQGLMEILDLDWMDFYVWTLNGNSLFRIKRNAEYWDLLKVALSDFWWEHVQPARELYSKSWVKDRLARVKLFKPTPRHELYDAINDASKCIANNSELVFAEKMKYRHDRHRIVSFNHLKRRSSNFRRAY